MTKSHRTEEVPPLLSAYFITNDNVYVCIYIYIHTIIVVIIIIIIIIIVIISMNIMIYFSQLGNLDPFGGSIFKPAKAQEA